MFENFIPHFYISLDFTKLSSILQGHVNVFIDLDDDDFIGGHVIGRFHANVTRNYPPVNGGRWTYHGKVHGKYILGPHVTFTVEMGCDAHFYGKDCTVWCEEDEHTICLPNGERKCKKGQECNMTMG